MEAERRTLPITAIRAQLLAALRTADAVVVSGETGSGKSTQVRRRWIISRATHSPSHTP